MGLRRRDLHPPSTATVVRVRDGAVLMTDGPYTEGKEHIGGFWIITAPDLDAALAWGRRLAGATTLPIEVRPFQDETGRLMAAGRCRPRRRSPVSSVKSMDAPWPCWSASFGDIDIAEEAVQEAFTAAVERWPSAGVPPSPAGWIITTARNRAINRLRREASRADRHAQAALLQPQRWRPMRPRRTSCAMTGCA